MLAEIFSRPVFNMVEALPYGLIEMSGGVGVGLCSAFSGVVGLCGLGFRI